MKCLFLLLSILPLPILAYDFHAEINPSEAWQFSDQGDSFRLQQPNKPLIKVKKGKCSEESMKRAIVRITAFSKNPTKASNLSSSNLSLKVSNNGVAFEIVRGSQKHEELRVLQQQVEGHFTKAVIECSPHPLK